MHYPPDTINPGSAKNQTGAPAGFWKRLLAHWVDGLILLIPSFICGFVIGLVAVISGMANAHDHAALSKLGILTGTIIGTVYVATFISSRWQATPGKRMLGIYIVRAGMGGRIGWLRAMMRYLVYCGFSIVVTFMAMAGEGPHAHGTLSLGNDFELKQLQQKIRNHEDLTAAEHQRFDYLNLLELMPSNPLTPQEQQQFVPIRDKMERKEILTPEETSRFDLFTMKYTLRRKFWIILFVLATGFYGIINCFMVALTREKTGIHDLVCGTRALKGRL